MLLTPTEGSAGGLSIWPVQVNLTADGSVQELQVNNPSDERSYVQVMAVEWHAPENINEAPHVEAILAVPPVFELDPDGNQLVRLAVRGPMDDSVERSYKLVITEVPRTAGLIPNSLAIAARMTLPIFVTPEGAVPVPVWTLQEHDKGKPSLMLANQGSAHIRVNNIQLIPVDKEKAVFETQEGALVLADKGMSWPLDIDLTKLKGPVIVKAQTNIGHIETAISLPGG